MELENFEDNPEKVRIELADLPCDLIEPHLNKSNNGKSKVIEIATQEEIPIGERNNNLYRMGQQIHAAFPGKKELAWELFNSFAKDKCASTYEEAVKKGEIKAIFHSASKSRIAKEAEQKQEKDIKKDLVLLDSTGILNREVEPVQWLIPHFLPKGGIAGLVGEAGVGKTFFAMKQTICILTGNKFFGKYEVEKGSICYVNVDMPFPVFQQRAKLLGLPESMPYYTFEKRQFSVEKYGDELLELIQEIKPKLVAFDTLRKIHSKKENDSTEMQEILNYFTKITDLGSSVLFLHHVAKNIPAYKGSTVIRDSVDVMLMMDKVKDCKFKNEYTIKFDKVRLEAETEVKDVKIRLTNKNGILEFEEIGEPGNENIVSEKPDRKSLRTTENQAKDFVIRGLISNQVKGIEGASKEEILNIAEKSGLNKRKVEDVLQKLVAEGKITKPRKNFYSLVQEGGEPPST